MKVLEEVLEADLRRFHLQGQYIKRMPSSIYFAFCFLSACLHVAATQGNDLELSIPPQDTSCNKLSQIEEIPVTGHLTIRSKELIKHNPHSYFVFEVSQPGSPYMETCRIAFASCTHERGRQCYCFSLHKVNYDVVYVHKAGLNEQKTWVRLSWLSVTGKELLDPQEGNLAHSYNTSVIKGITINNEMIHVNDGRCESFADLRALNTLRVCCPPAVPGCDIDVLVESHQHHDSNCAALHEVPRSDLERGFVIKVTYCVDHSEIIFCDNPKGYKDLKVLGSIVINNYSLELKSGRCGLFKQLKLLNVLSVCCSSIFADCNVTVLIDAKLHSDQKCISLQNITRDALWPGFAIRIQFCRTLSKTYVCTHTRFLNSEDAGRFSTAVSLLYRVELTIAAWVLSITVTSSTSQRAN
ncbi:uncharacterized protein LOC131954315 isoform X3 [Physella acuta]|uniref:uncharacterized protein LOC131954315 isoform X3 n=1 Tax=Physella acuta TaxID=109671 RepID=UPI0027DB2CCF|nr:uncharacterized protein LOC131954315 isoform X3 [Physella acuta]